MAHVPQLIIDLALILGAAGVTTLVFRQLKQPLVLGYILAGLLVGPNFPIFPTITDQATIRIWAEIGVIFLLFGLGLEFSFKKLVKVGGSASVTGLVEIGAMLLLGYTTGQWLGWSGMDSLFLGGIIAISSTTIIIRAFDELGLKTQQFAGIVFGITFHSGCIAAICRYGTGIVYCQAEFFSYSLVSGRHLPHPLFLTQKQPADYQRNAAGYFYCPLSVNGGAGYQSRILCSIGCFYYGLYSGRNTVCRKDRTPYAAGKRPVRSCVLRICRHAH
jgi:hypothetical protein